MALIRPLPEAHFDMDAVDADIDFAIPYGLILNELLLNATKHAFAGISEPRLSVTLTLNGESLILDVQDNGSGLPPDFREKRRRSLGMQLIDSLVEQLGGSISFSSEGGTRCTIEFPSLNEANPAGQTSR
jgi:two-component sensor histidine kinase